MDWALLIYLMDVVSSLDIFLITLGIVLGVATLVSWACALDLDEDKLGKKILLIGLPIAMVVFLLAVFIPSESTMQTMLAAHLGQLTVEGIGNLEGIETIPQDVLDVTKGFLESMKEKQQGVSE